MKLLSPLGFLLESLSIPTVSLSRELHVDASLVSKWKSGKRQLKSNSIYFDSIVDFIIDESEKSNHQILSKSLSEMFPMDELDESDDLEPFVRTVLSKNEMLNTTIPNLTSDSMKHCIKVSSYEQNEGRRQAISKLLSFAEAMPSPGEIIFIDSDEYEWLLEEDDFAMKFCKRIRDLLNKGFKAKFVIHFYSYKKRLVKFFDKFNILVFHPNIKWYYHEYYDENALHFSQFIINKSISLLGVSTSSQNSSTTMVFTDSSSIIKHWSMAESLISYSNELFINFETDRCREVVDYVSVIRKRGTVYSYLPSPAFVSTSSELIHEILTDNNVSDKNIERCIKLNSSMKNMVKSQYHGLYDVPERIVYLFHLEELVKRAHSSQFVSCSLSLMSEKTIKVSKLQYSRALRELVISLKKYDNLEIVLVSENDNVPLPALPEMNCWCKQNTWLIQMSKDGFRISDEVSIVNATSIALEKSIRMVPRNKRSKEYVIPLLINLSNELENEFNEIF